MLPVSPGSMEFTITVVGPGITTSNEPDIIVVLPGSDWTTSLTWIVLAIETITFVVPEMMVVRPEIETPGRNGIVTAPETTNLEVPAISVGLVNQSGSFR